MVMGTIFGRLVIHVITLFFFRQLMLPVGGHFRAGYLLIHRPNVSNPFYLALLLQGNMKANSPVYPP
jgi:hypothetical protein